jgi:site-specific recombinase XerD
MTGETVSAQTVSKLTRDLDEAVRRLRQSSGKTVKAVTLRKIVAFLAEGSKSNALQRSRGKAL